MCSNLPTLHSTLPALTLAASSAALRVRAAVRLFSLMYSCSLCGDKHKATRGSSSRAVVAPSQHSDLHSCCPKHFSLLLQQSKSQSQHSGLKPCPPPPHTHVQPRTLICCSSMRSSCFCLMSASASSCSKARHTAGVSHPNTTGCRPFPPKSSPNTNCFLFSFQHDTRQHRVYKRSARALLYPWSAPQTCRCP